MLPRPRRTLFSRISRALWLAGILLLLLPTSLLASPTRRNVVSRDNISPAQRQQVAAKLREITGLPALKFDEDGILHEGTVEPIGGSESARALVANAIHGRNVVVLEDASGRADVAFCRVIPGKWKSNLAGSPPVFVIQIDFVDFDRVVGDERALEAFNVGWGLLHELDHIVSDSPDTMSLGETGECEAHINQMRRECGLPERTGYFYTPLPLSTDHAFITRFVRLAFEEPQPRVKKKKRYWVVWDANVVGGLEPNQVVASR